MISYPEPNLSLLEPTDLNHRRACLFCQRQSHTVSRRTMLLMLKPKFFDRIGDGQYYYCASSDCEVVYFPETEGTQFYKEDLRVRVGAKEKKDPKPICYCFGFDESDFGNEICETGQTTIPAQIIKMVKAGMCACDTRNPSGACCLGEITKTVKRFQTELTRG